MEYKINDISVSEREVEVTLAYDEIKDGIETEVKKQTKKIQLPGFRKGKVPLNILKKMYGDALEHEASEKVANNQFWEIANEKHLHPIGQPSLTDIKFNPGEDLFFKVKYEVMPNIEVKDYTEQDIEVPKFEVKDEDVENEIQYIQKSNSTKEPADIIGDDKNYLVDVEIQRIDEENKPVEGVKPERLEIDLTSERIQPEIVENSKGKKVDENFTFSFSDERTVKNEEGKEEEVTDVYNYVATIKGIKKIVPAELNEELIKKVTKDKATNEEELRKEIKSDVQKYYDQRMDELLRDKLLTTVVKNNDFPPPNSLVLNVLEDLVKREEEQSKKEGYRSFDKTEAATRLRKIAELEVKWFILKSEIQKKEKLEVGEDELKELAEKDAEKTGIAVDKLLNYYKSSNYGERLIDNKLFDFLKEKNNIKNVDPEKISKKEEESK